MKRKVISLLIIKLMTEKRWRVSITREESIPFREWDGTIMQMVQYRTSVTVEQWEFQSVEELETEISEILQRNQDYILWKDPQYLRMKKQLNLLMTGLKKHAPIQEFKSIILQAKKITDD